MRLYVIAGHGAGDPGAVGCGHTEAGLVRELAARLGSMGGGAVTVLNTARNWYADNGISRLSLPADAQLLELHMDAGPAAAHGAHVIINGRYSADEYDTALASFLAGFMPGRSSTLVGRTDLANSNRAAAKGISYRLAECGFVTNAADVDRFMGRMGELAAGILAAFGIEAKGESMSEDVEKAAREILRTDDPTGRGVHMTTHEHVKWIAAKQADMAERLERIEAALTRSEQDGKVTGELN